MVLIHHDTVGRIEIKDKTKYMTNWGEVPSWEIFISAYYKTQGCVDLQLQIKFTFLHIQQLKMYSMSAVG